MIYHCPTYIVPQTGVRGCLSSQRMLVSGLIMLVLLAFASPAAAQFAGGNGTAGNPYQISNLTQLQAMRDAPNTSHFILINDIDATASSNMNSGQGFNPVGWFGGSFDGQGFTITGFTINRPGTSNSGMFSSVGANGVLRNVRFVNPVINGGGGSAVLVGTTAGLIENITVVNGSVTTNSQAGGIAGQIDGGGIGKNLSFQGQVSGSNSTGGIVGLLNSNAHLEDVSFNGSITGSNLTGGIAGQNNSGSSITGAEVTVNLTASGTRVGGVTGYNNQGNLSFASVSGTVNGGNEVGGIAGRSEGWGSSITDSHFDGLVIGNTSVGGVVGFVNDSLTEKTYSLGEVRGITDVGGVAGFVGWSSTSVIRLSFSLANINPAAPQGNHNQFGGLVGAIQGGIIENSFARGDVNGNNRVGGLVGQMTSGAQVINAYSTGAVNPNAGGHPGGLIGRNQGSTVTNSYWDVQTSGYTYSAGGTGRNTTWMLNPQNFINAGWDFTNIWSWDPGINDGYPYITPLGSAFIFVWTGNIDIVWEKPGNWSTNSLPEASSNIRIPPVPNQPRISSDVVVANITIQDGSTLTIGYDGSLQVTAQINNLNGTDGFLVESGENGTGSLLHQNNLDGRFQRYVSGEPETWHMLSSPVGGQAILGSMFTPTGGENPYGDNTRYDFYAWHEPDTSWVYILNTEFAPTWATIHPQADFVPGRGYLVSYLDPNPTLVFEGSLTQGSVSIPVTRSPGTSPEFGHNLVGNPYPSSIDWKANEGLDRSALETDGGGYVYWVWNDQANNYGTFNSASNLDEITNGASRFIPPNQGFFVRAATNGNLSFSNQIRVHDGADNWIKSDQAAFTSTLRVRVTSLSDQSFDEIAVEFDDREQKGGSPKKFSFIPTAPSLYIPQGSQPYSFIMPGPQENSPVIPIGFKAGRNGEYQFEIEYDRFDFDMLKLEDLHTRQTHDLLTEPVFRFQATTGDKSGRFVLYLKEGTYPNPHADLPARAFTSTNQLYLDLRLLDSQTEYTVQVIDLSGRIKHSSPMTGGSLQQIPAQHLQGIYIVRIIGSQGVYTEKLFF